ncbi:MAG TPA: MBL fold metallo-hydrolase [Candidatus Sulfotelmatobacter sp.]|nr:MBL fold metallo-hydrolase [Candidatus Sulfotelmatobacter sp.]
MYSKKMLTYCDLNYCKPEIDGVFVSHAHSDHIGHLKFLDPTIPVYMGVGTKLFMESMEETSNFCDYGKHPCNLFRTGDKIKVGNITVEPIHVDHSIPAAYGFIIHTSAGTVVYTGDLRRHGPRKDLTEDFLQRAKDVEPVALVCEGTRMASLDNRQNYSEPEVKKLANKVVASTDKMVFTARYSRDIDRFNSFYKVAKKNNRKLVITPKTAHLLTKLLDDEHLTIPDPRKDKHIAVYYKRKKSSSFDDKDYYVWERQFMNNKITYDYVRKHQSNLLMDLDFSGFTELIDIKPNVGSDFIHSMSEPFSEEDIEEQVMHNWINYFKMNFHQMHASGHMAKNQLIEMVNHIQPKLAFSVHTENQRLFKDCCNQIQTIEYGTPYILR